MKLLDKDKMTEWALEEMMKGNISEENIYLIIQGTWIQNLRKELLKSNEFKNYKNNKLKKEEES